jgi:uncharacterized protein YbbC (DUF1343 family)
MDNEKQDTIVQPLPIKTGAEQTELYYPLLKEKRIGIVSNQTGMIGPVHLIDSLVSAGFDVQVIFAPEHGFRGHAEAGEKVSSDHDPVTGIRVISLYGSHFKPSQEDLTGLDIMIFDIQDVGARFYTYISTMHYVMEACAEAGIPLIILDRPNPNGFYVDGPVLKPDFRSFIGMHPIPVIHGMTVGELSLMINGEGWLGEAMQCDLTVIPVAGYTHKTIYELPVAPSPNLQTPQSVLLYPSLCLFEGTVMSVGRGTDTPFEVFGHPLWPDKTFSFTPESRPGYAAKPPCMGQICYGMNLHDDADSLKQHPRLELKWLLDAYAFLHEKTDFFSTNMFDKLTGSSQMRQQIIEGKSEKEIRESWQPGLDEFKQKRKKYLLYEDFE